MKSTHLILDFDGVIGDTFEACVLAHLHLEPELSREKAEEKLRA